MTEAEVGEGSPSILSSSTSTSSPSTTHLSSSSSHSPFSSSISHMNHLSIKSEDNNLLRLFHPTDQIIKSREIIWQNARKTIAGIEETDENDNDSFSDGSLNWYITRIKQMIALQEQCSNTLNSYKQELDLRVSEAGLLLECELYDNKLSQINEWVENVESSMENDIAQLNSSNSRNKLRLMKLLNIVKKEVTKSEVG